MGRQKLLLPWGDGVMIDQVLDAWTKSSVSNVVVVVRRDDSELAQVCQQHDVIVVQPLSDPPDMKASVQVGLEMVERKFKPESSDGCFIAPADLPTLSSEIINQLATQPATEDSVVIPMFGKKQGHPARLPWAITNEIYHLADDQGVDCIINRHPKTQVHFPAADRILDVDTPEQYDQIRK